MVDPGGRPAGARPGHTYDLGIDLGTTFTAAAVRIPGENTARVVRLEKGADQIPSVVLVGHDGQLEVGGEAERRASTSPERIVREFKRRLGDDTPMIVGDTAFSADSLAAETILWTVEQVTEIEGTAPRRIAVSHPAGWGVYRRKLFADALQEVGLPDVVLLTEPEAAAVAHGTSGTLAAGATIAVYDLGGGTFDTAVIRGPGSDPERSGVAVLGQAQGLESLGGIDFDEALFWHVCAELGGAVAALDPADPATLRAVASLRRTCVAAKERLSVDTEAIVEVDLPGVRTRVRVSRTEFEEMIEPALHQTADVLGEVLDAAGIGNDQLDGILLVGGSSRIPLVARVIGRTFGCPVSVDADPTSIVARGAALGADPASGSGAEPASSVISVARRKDVAAVVSAALGGRAGRASRLRARVDTGPAPEPVGSPDADPRPDTDRTVGTEPTVPPRPALARFGPLERHGDTMLTAPLPAQPAQPSYVGPARPPVLMGENPPPVSEPRSRARHARSSRRKTVIGVSVGVLLGAALVAAATVPIVDEAPAPAPAVPTLSAPGQPGGP